MAAAGMILKCWKTSCKIHCFFSWCLPSLYLLKIWISFGGRKTWNPYLLDMLAMSIFQGHISSSLVGPLIDWTSHLNHSNMRQAWKSSSNSGENNNIFSQLENLPQIGVNIWKYLNCHSFIHSWKSDHARARVRMNRTININETTTHTLHPL